MNCHEAEPLLNAYFDGEVDVLRSMDIEHHTLECKGCREALERLAALRRELEWAGLDLSEGVNLAPLRSRIERRIHPRTYWKAAFTAVAAAAVFMVFVWTRPGGMDARGIVDDHIRSMMAEHLVDIPSSDRHTVKPWFQGKLDFAPETPDLTSQGFGLAGGRLDVIQGHPAAAIVYRRRGHVINLWMTRSNSRDPARREVRAIDGYNVIAWRKGEFTYWVVSDLNAGELRGFAELF